MRKPSSSSKYVIAALVAATLGLTAGPALAQTTSASSQRQTRTSLRPASKKSVRQVTSQVKHEREQMAAATKRLDRATAQLQRTTRHLKAAQAKEMRVASAERGVRKRAHQERLSRMHARTRHHPANANPPQH